MHTPELSADTTPAGSGTLPHIPHYTMRLLRLALRNTMSISHSTALAPSLSPLFLAPQPQWSRLSLSGSMNHLTIGAIIIAFWNEHLLEFLPGLLLGVLPLSHTPGHVCGKTTQSSYWAGEEDSR